MAKKAESSDDPWYRDGLQFKCTGCGDCCTGAPGYVWLNNAEVNDLAAELGITTAEVEQRFVRKVGIRKSLVEHKNGDCVFFDNQSRKCQVYAARPRQCRTWPFWDSNLKSPETWAEACEACPGSGVGRLYQLSEIEAQRKEIRV